MTLNSENYYSRESDSEYMSYSQFKDFLTCESMALAVVEGRFDKPTTPALLQGSYVDAHFSGELDKFKEDHPELFKQDGKLKQQYAVCENVIDAIERSVEFRNMFYGGDSQTILTGEIGGVPFKGKIDMLYEDRIVDMKCLKDLNPIWDDEERRRKPFYSYYRYDIQAAIYRELVRQNTGKTLPFFLAVATKEECPKLAAYEFSPEVLDAALAEVVEKAPRFQAIKKHLEEPVPCGDCDHCRTTIGFSVFDIREIKKEDM